MLARFLVVLLVFHFAPRFALAIGFRVPVNNDDDNQQPQQQAPDYCENLPLKYQPKFLAESGL